MTGNFNLLIHPSFEGQVLHTATCEVFFCNTDKKEHKSML